MKLSRPLLGSFLLVTGTDIFLFLATLIIGIQQNSSMLVGDSLRKFVYLFAELVEQWGRHVSSRASSDTYTYGFTRATAVATLFSSGVFVGLAAVLAINAVTKCIVIEDMSSPKVVFIVSTVIVQQSIMKNVVRQSISLSRQNRQKDVDTCHVSPTSTPLITDENQILDNSNVQEPTGSTEISTHNPRLQTHGSWACTTAPGQPPTQRHVSKQPIRSKNVKVYGKIEDLNNHPASFRQQIIVASRAQAESERENDMNGMEETSSSTPAYEEPAIVRQGHRNLAPRNYEQEANRDLEINHYHPSRKRAKISNQLGRSIWAIGEVAWAIALLTTAAIIWKYPHSKFEYLDPAFALLASILALWYSNPVVRASGRILLNAAPEEISTHDIRDGLQNIPGVIFARHLHVWTLDGRETVATVQVQVSVEREMWIEVEEKMRKVFHAHGVDSTTIQPEFR
ncbi:Fc.00g084710.m01.CDS01 [Cosmosporella sp. VM-42]